MTFQTDINHDQDSDTDMIIDHSELSIGENSQISASPSLNSTHDKEHTEVSLVKQGSSNVDILNLILAGIVQLFEGNRTSKMALLECCRHSLIDVKSFGIV